MFDPAVIKKDFPIFAQGNLVYLDNAATSQKPQCVIDAISDYYSTMNANIHRGVYTLSEKATEKYEATREKIANFLNAKSAKEIIFTRNATEAINLLAYTLSNNHINEGDEIVVSELEHHSNLVPWQEVCKRKKATLKVIPIKNDYTLDIEAYHELLSPKTKLVAITAMSNVLGTRTPLKEIIEAAHKQGALVLVDGAQSAAHSKSDMQDLNCDFFAMSAHKMLGPTGVGILYGKEELLENLPPFLYGGDMISSVKQYSSIYAELPAKFEAGTPNIADVIAFSTALDYLNELGFETIESNDKKLFEYTVNMLSKYKEVTLFTPPESEAGPVVSFDVKGIHPHDLASVFNEDNICIRAGHHCAQPLIEKFNLPATARISFYIYNTTEDIDRAEKALQKALQIFA